MNVLIRFGRFWYDFIVGDDWTIAAAVVIALAITYAVTHHGSPQFWMLLPAVIVVILATSLWREARRN